MAENGTQLEESSVEFQTKDHDSVKDRPIYVQEAGYGEEGLFQVLKKMVCQIVYPEERMPFIQRIRGAWKENGPFVKEAAKNSTENLVQWMHRGGAWRALLVITVGMILLLALTGFGAFMLFFLAATTNTIVVSLLMSLAVVGGFMVFFFTCLTAIYVGALSIAAFVISAATLVTVSAVVIAAGWIGFFWLVWQGIRKSLNVTRSSFLMTASALAAISTKGSTRNPNHRKIY